MRIRYLSRFTRQRRAAINLERMEGSAFRFAAFVGEIVSVIGHVDRERPLNDYCAGLMVTEGRRSVEPIAAVTAPREVPAQHQRLLHFVANAPWSDAAVLAKVRELIFYNNSYGPVDDKYYGLPMKNITGLVMMNKGHLDEAGLEIPTEWTWDEYRDYAKTMTTDEHYGSYLHTWHDLFSALKLVSKPEETIDSKRRWFIECR